MIKIPILFDDGYFSPQSEGNLNIPLDHHITHTYERLNAGRSGWSIQRPPNRSILTPSMKLPTLNSFAAFSDAADTVATMPADLQNVGNGYTFSPSVDSYYDPKGNPVTYQQALAGTEDLANPMSPANTVYTPAAGATRTSPVAPAAASSGNSVIDAISGIIKAFTPAASAAAAGKPAAPTASSALQQFLQGRLPGASINSSGQVVQASPMAPILIIGGVGLLLYYAMRSGPSRSRRSRR